MSRLEYQIHQTAAPKELSLNNEPKEKRDVRIDPEMFQCAAMFLSQRIAERHSGTCSLCNTKGTRQQHGLVDELLSRLTNSPRFVYHHSKFIMHHQYGDVIEWCISKK